MVKLNNIIKTMKLIKIQHIELGRRGNTVGSQRNLTKRQKEILIGMLLGDCCLEKRWKKCSFKNWPWIGSKRLFRLEVSRIPEFNYS